MEPLERKVDHAEVRPDTDTTGTYHVVGRLMGVFRSDGEFRYEQHANGWHSESLHPRTDGWRISGGFLVSRVDDQRSRITHCEDYVMPDKLRRFRRPMQTYMKFSQRSEMRGLKKLAERQPRSV